MGVKRRGACMCVIAIEQAWRGTAYERRNKPAAGVRNNILRAAAARRYYRLVINLIAHHDNHRAQRRVALVIGISCAAAALTAMSFASIAPASNTLFDAVIAWLDVFALLPVYGEQRMTASSISRRIK